MTAPQPDQAESNTNPDDVLRRMLNTPPKPKEAPAKEPLKK